MKKGESNMAGYVRVDEKDYFVEMKIYCHKTTNHGMSGSHISERLGRIRDFEVTEENIVERIKYFLSKSRVMFLAPASVRTSSAKQFLLQPTRGFIPKSRSTFT